MTQCCSFSWQKVLTHVSLRSLRRLTWIDTFCRWNEPPFLQSGVIFNTLWLLIKEVRERKRIDKVDLRTCTERGISPLPLLTTSRKKLLKIFGKKEDTGIHRGFLLLPQCFLPFPERNHIAWAIMYLSTANVLNFGWSKTFSRIVKFQNGTYRCTSWLDNGIQLYLMFTPFSTMFPIVLNEKFRHLNNLLTLVLPNK